MSRIEEVSHQILVSVSTSSRFYKIMQVLMKSSSFLLFLVFVIREVRVSCH